MVTPLYWPHLGGVENHTKRVSEELTSQGHDVTILTTRHEDALPAMEYRNGVKILRFPGRRLSQGRSFLMKNRGLLKDNDVVHCHDYSSFINLVLPFRFIYPWKPIYVTFHGHEGILPIPRNIIMQRRLTAFLTKGNICIGDFIPKWYGTKEDFILYGGTDEAPKEGEMGPGAAFIGRLEPDTGIQYLH